MGFAPVGHIYSKIVSIFFQFWGPCLHPSIDVVNYGMDESPHFTPPVYNVLHMQCEKPMSIPVYHLDYYGHRPEPGL